MAAPVSIEVVVDSSEFSRYEEDHKIITATVVISGGAPYVAEDILVDLVKSRRSRDAVVSSATLSFTAATSPQQDVVTFDLTTLEDQDFISLVRHGRYFVRATSVTDEDIIGESPDFDIRIVTVDTLKNKYLYGLDLKATEVLAPKLPPTAITGITVAEVSRNTSKGFGDLNYIYNEEPAVGAIGSGTDGTVSISSEGALANTSGNGIIVDVLVPAGTSALSAVFVAPTLTVSLDVTGGAPNAGANTATLVAAAIDALPDFAATASGTGATALSAPEDTTLAGGTLVRQMSWRGGTLVSITGPGIIILPEGLTGPAAKLGIGVNPNYICIRVTSVLLLPTVSRVESLLMENKAIDDDLLGCFLQQAIDYLEGPLLATRVEPTNVVSDRDPTTIQFSAGANAPAPLFTDNDFDFLESPLTYYPHEGGTWIQIQTPYNSLLRVDSLFGSIANVRIIDIDLAWIEHSVQGGFIQLVPYNQKIAFDFLGLLWVNGISGNAPLPSFWSFNVIVGLRSTPKDIQEYIGKKAAMEVLGIAGLAKRPGVGSLSLSRDGVSESQSFTTTAQYGLYTGLITQYKEWLDETTPMLKGKYRGATLRVM